MFVVTREELLHGNIYKGLIKITIPLIFLNLINVLYGVVDTYFVGMIDELQVGAVSLISPMVNCGAAFATGLAAAGIALISRNVGKNDYEKTKQVASHLIFLCIVLGIFACAVLLIFGKPILNWFETPAEIYDSAYAYLVGISFDFVFLFIVTIYQAIRQGHGDSKSGVIVNMAAALFNCMLDPIFIFIFGWGTFGAAIATTLSKALMTPYALHMLKKEGLIGNIFQIDKTLIKEIVIVAIPSSLGNFMSSFGFILMQKEIAAYGSLALSAYGIGNKISSVYNIFVNAWGSGLTTYIGASLGANDHKRANKAFRTSMAIVAITALIFVPLGLLTSRKVISLFIRNVSDELMNMAANYVYFAVCTAFAMGWFMNLCGVFNGSSNTLISMLLTGSRVWFIRIPIIKLLNTFTNLGVSNIWIAMNLSNIIVSLIGMAFYLKYDWKNRSLKL